MSGTVEHVESPRCKCDDCIQDRRNSRAVAGLEHQHQVRVDRLENVHKRSHERYEARISRADEDAIAAKVHQVDAERLNQTRRDLAATLKRIREDVESVRWPLRDPHITTRQMRRDLNQVYDLLGKLQKAVSPAG